MDKKLSKGAYGGVAGKDYVPYISDKNNTGGNLIVLLIGILLAALFAASTAYSGMKAGLTVAAGIPGAIVGAGLISVLAKNKGILGTNLVQGMSSGGESVASGIIFVLPAILLIGGKINFLEGVGVGIAGVLIGIGVASLVHNYLIVEEHGQLMYPESMAISETLVASDTGGEALKYMGIGFGIGGVITLLSRSVLGVANNVISYVGDTAYKWKFELEVNPLLLGIGFIVGLEVSLTMFAGSILANFAVNPLIGYFADMAKDGVMVWNDPNTAINAMDVGTISGAYGRYIGAGMMLCGGIIGAIKLIPVIITSVKQTFAAKSGEGESNSMQFIILIAGVVLAFVAGFVISQGNIVMAILGAVVSLILMFLFVIVAGRLTGTIGTSNLPVSGMTIASLVILTLIFVVMGWTSEIDNKILLLFGTLIVTSIAMSGGYLQSQKVTYIIGGNKNEMQKYFTIAGLVGVIVVVGTIVILATQLTEVNAQGEPIFALPQGRLMATLTSGIMSGNLPWVMIFAGIFLAIVCHLLKLPIMTVAIGFYLPIATTSIILVGALIRVLVEKVTKDEAERDARVSNGVSLSSGLVAGGSIIGLIGIALQVMKVINLKDLTGFAAGNGIAIILLIIVVVATACPILFGKIKKQ
ncbi:putative OPT family oligopeptide transporter [Bacilli bacterium PM5-3]|nr:putative OPT family oligopeptide transporter [Bacilli bacterium PM5-3]